MCNVYRKFVPNFARNSDSLTQTLRKGVEKALPPPTGEQVSSFELLINALISPPVLRLPDAKKPFSIGMDVCNDQIGCALFNEGEDGFRHPAGFWSRS